MRFEGLAGNYRPTIHDGRIRLAALLDEVTGIAFEELISTHTDDHNYPGARDRHKEFFFMPASQV